MIDPRDAHLERTDEADDEDRLAAYYERQCEDYKGPWPRRGCVQDDEKD